MAGLPRGPLRRLLSRLPSRRLARHPPVSPMSPPGLPPVTRAEILSRYRHLRQVSKKLHQADLARLRGLASGGGDFRAVG